MFPATHATRSDAGRSRRAASPVPAHPGPGLPRRCIWFLPDRTPAGSYWRSRTVRRKRLHGRCPAHSLPHRRCSPSLREQRHTACRSRHLRDGSCCIWLWPPASIPPAFFLQVLDLYSYLPFSDKWIRLLCVTLPEPALRSGNGRLLWRFPKRLYGSGFRPRRWQAAVLHRWRCRRRVCLPWFDAIGQGVLFPQVFRPSPLDLAPRAHRAAGTRCQGHLPQGQIRRPTTLWISKNSSNRRRRKRLVCCDRRSRI